MNKISTSLTVFAFSAVASCSPIKETNTTQAQLPIIKQTEVGKTAVDRESLDANLKIITALCQSNAQYVEDMKDEIPFFKKMKVPHTDKDFGPALKPGIDNLIALYDERKAYAESPECQAELNRLEKN